jgi:signal peptide peptidase SppA
MHHLSSDLWLMEKNAMRQFLAMTHLGANTDSEVVRASSEPRREKTIAILPVHGVLEARPSFFGSFFGMSSYERIGYQFDMLMADESVKGVILDVASPGGMVYGCQELAHKIFSARGVKPIIAVANPMAASGGYWLAAAADRVIASPSADVGSVGVIWEHVDASQANEREGVKVTVIRSTDSPHKAEANSMEPLTDDAKQNMQARADEIYQKFASDLARFRGVDISHVKENFGKGRVVGAKQAMQAGMIDRVDTLQSVAYKMAAGRVRISSVRAEDNWDAPTDRELRMQRAVAIKAIAEQPPERTEDV